MTDENPFVLASEVKVGDFLSTDAGFTCLEEGETKQVFQDAQYADRGDDYAGLYIHCREGKHYLGGQLGGPFGGFESCDHLVGLWKLDQ